jgi:hypothetical protein
MWFIRGYAYEGEGFGGCSGLDTEPGWNNPGGRVEYLEDMTRETLHGLIDRIPAARRFLEYLASSPAYRAALAAPQDDEPVTEGDAGAIDAAREDVRAGRVVSHDEVLREFGLR